MPPSVVAPTLRGIILRDDEDRVIVQASPQEIREFAPQRGQEVAVRPEVPPVRLRRRGLMYGMAAPLSHYVYGGVVSWPSVTANLDPTEASGPPEPVGRLRPDDYLYDRGGRPVARITSVDVGVEYLEPRDLGETFRRYQASEPEVVIHARGLPGVQLLG